MISSREKTMRRVRFHQEKTNPSFSSTLLDEIYRSIDDSDSKNDNLNLSFRDLKVKKKQSNNNGDLKSNTNNRAIFDRQNDGFSFRNEGLIEKMMDNKKANEKMISKRRQILTEFDRKPRNSFNEGVCFSSSSCSSDSSSGGFSSSETEHNLKPKVKPKPIRTKQSMKETEHRHQQQQHNFEEKDGILKLKLGAMKIYSNLKKVKQPISPGARLSTFINSLFTSSGHGDNKKKSKFSSSNGTFDKIDKVGSAKTPMCSSATSFSRSCLSKNTSCTREDSRKSVEKVVKFYPASGLADEKSDHKSGNEMNARRNPAPILLKSTNLSKIRTDKEHKFQLIEKNRKTEQQAALKQYIEAKQKNNFVNKSNFRSNYKKEVVEDEDDDASDSSSDLFELDHLAFSAKNHRYCEELPVYATTRVITNRAIC